MNAQPVAERIVFTDADFAYLSQVIHQNAGIVLGEGKRDLIYGRLARRIRTLGLKDFASYCNFVRDNIEAELSHLINAVTTNVTAFMREPHHFDLMATEVLPAAAARNRQNRRLRIWSAGCSTGEEPWSIAMVLAETGLFEGWDARILATDIDSNVLEIAGRGEYPINRAEPLDKNMARRWLHRGAENMAGQVRIADQLRPLVTFLPLNLQSDAWPMRGPFDVIFCRNVMIYFSAEARERLVKRMTSLLIPGGYLFLGHSESLSGINVVLERRAHTAFRRP